MALRALIQRLAVIPAAIGVVVIAKLLQSAGISDGLVAAWLIGGSIAALMALAGALNRSRARNPDEVGRFEEEPSRTRKQQEPASRVAEGRATGRGGTGTARPASAVEALLARRAARLADEAPTAYEARPVTAEARAGSGEYGVTARALAHALIDDIDDHQLPMLLEALRELRGAREPREPPQRPAGA